VHPSATAFRRNATSYNWSHSYGMLVCAIDMLSLPNGNAYDEPYAGIYKAFSLFQQVIYYVLHEAKQIKVIHQINTVKPVGNRLVTCSK